MEAEIVLKISQLSDESKIELIDFMEWIAESKATPEQITAEMERRISITV